jgi:hypothetical protein
VISILALFVALGGSAYAAKKIGTKEIKANAITTGKIKKNAVTTSKIKKEAVTGAKIKESTLGAVPNATHAVSADSATNATTATTATNFSRYYTSGLKKANVGETVTLLSVGPFTFIGKCTEAGGEKIARSYLTTSRSGSNMYSEYGDSFDENDFNPGTEAEAGYPAENSGTEVAFWGSYYTIVTAESADASFLLEGQANAAVNAFGAPCAFAVNVTNNA